MHNHKFTPKKPIGYQPIRKAVVGGKVVNHVQTTQKMSRKAIVKHTLMQHEVPLIIPAHTVGNKFVPARKAQGRPIEV